MSLVVMQDNLVKTSLVQQTQTRGEDVQRGQEISQAATHREEDRQSDQVVLMSQQKDNQGIRTDEEREKEERRKKRKREEEEEENAEEAKADSSEGESPAPGPRAVMRRINIVI